MGGVHSLDVNFIDEEDNREPWKRRQQTSTKLSGNLPEQLSITLSNLIYFEKSQLPSPLANRLIRLAANVHFVGSLGQIRKLQLLRC